jgi:hypothetical protein
MIKDFLLKNRANIIIFLTIAILLLCIAILWKSGIVSLSALKEQKDSISAIQSILTIIFLIFGAVASYYRFFRGRTFSTRAELELDVSIHKCKDQFYLHAISLTAKNVGTISIWNPKPKIQVQIHSQNDKEKIRVISDWWEEDSSDVATEMVTLIDSGETVTFFAHQEIPLESYAVTYLASMSCDSGDIWHTAKTISNENIKA